MVNGVGGQKTVKLGQVSVGEPFTARDEGGEVLERGTHGANARGCGHDADDERLKHGHIQQRGGAGAIVVAVHRNSRQLHAHDTQHAVVGNAVVTGKAMAIAPRGGSNVRKDKRVHHVM